MTWEGFYLVCFVIGFALAVIGFLGGTLHLPHLPGHAGLGPSAPPISGGLHSGGIPAASTLSPFNFATFMVFLAWFGGAGYLLTARGNLARSVVLAGALVCGLAGAAIVFGFLTRILLRHERALDSADFDMIGVLGSVTVPIRAGGTGEIVYSQAGTRRSSGARSDASAPIARGCEVVVTRYERGIAYVRPWRELTGMESPEPETAREEITDANPPIS